MAQSAPASTVQTGDERLAALKAWLAPLADRFGLVTSSLRPASADASARRYFRVDCDGGTVIAMDAPPPERTRGPSFASPR